MRNILWGIYFGEMYYKTTATNNSVREISTDFIQLMGEADYSPCMFFSALISVLPLQVATRL